MVGGLKVNLPHPARYAFQKLIVSDRRRDRAKSVKDRVTAVQIIKTLISSDRSESVRLAFRSMPRRWQNKVRKTLKEVDEAGIEAVLSSQ